MPPYFSQAVITADRQLASAIEQAGVRVALVWAAPQRQVRTYALTDLVWALAARRAAARGLAVHRPRAVLYSSVTAALLWPRPGAIRFDALAGANRPGRHGIWQRPLERRRLAQAPLLVPASEGAMSECARACDAERVRTIVLPIPVEPSGPAAGRRDIAAITYAGNPAKKGLDRVLSAWSRARREGEQLVVAGVEEEEALAGAPPGVTVVGRLAPEAYRRLLRRSRVFVTAPRREDYGAAQLEALADGCQLVTTVAPGPYAALPGARAGPAPRGRRPGVVAAHRPGRSPSGLRGAGGGRALALPRGGVPGRGRRPPGPPPAGARAGAGGGPGARLGPAAHRPCCAAGYLKTTTRGRV